VSALPREYPGWMLERQGEYRRNQLAQQNLPFPGAIRLPGLFFPHCSQKTILLFD
jgi:hypothetical protein